MTTRPLYSLILLCTALLYLPACNGHVSPNLQFSALRSAGDVSATSILDNSSDEALPKRQKDFEKYLNAVNEFLNHDSVESLVQASLRDNLERIQKSLSIPGYLTPLIDDALDSLARRDVPVGEELGKLNVVRISEFIYGARQATARYRVDFRVKSREPEKTSEEPGETLEDPEESATQQEIIQKSCSV